ncbi:MAG TPA: endolytic transglycosylase MltG [Gemmatimonadales bacterium]|jgi:UPF0755 protein
MNPRTAPHVLLIGLGALVGACVAQPEGPSEMVTIPRGATLATVIDSLQARGIIVKPRFFRFYARVTGQARRIQAGTYSLPSRSTVRRVLAVLVAGRPAEVRLVVPEGLWLEEVASVVERQLGIPAESLMVAARDSMLIAHVGAPAATLEGYLYPSTYLVRRDARAGDVVRQMVEEFERQWRPEWNARLDSLGFARHQLVTLASIIEGEVRDPRDRRYVSSVYHNRLKRGMRLQADPTVAYGLHARRRLFERDLFVRSPYNTYAIDGLPPGPIGAPSAASMEAALYPAKTDFLYFVARVDGLHVFSRTYAEHLDAIRDIRSP